MGFCLGEKRKRVKQLDKKKKRKGVKNWIEKKDKKNTI